MATAKPKMPTLYAVRESFVIDVDGVPVAYRKGEPVDPADPVLKRVAEAHFEPLRFPHPVSIASEPEVRA